MGLDGYYDRCPTQPFIMKTTLNSLKTYKSLCTRTKKLTRRYETQDPPPPRASRSFVSLLPNDVLLLDARANGKCQT